MRLSGGCYCGDVRYEAQGDLVLKAQCHCRECQYISGGHPNVVIGMPESGFAYTAGSPKRFRRDDLEAPVAREFCARCGTHLAAKAPALPETVLLKVGTLDHPEVFGQAAIAIHTLDRQSFHGVAEGITAFERLPG